MSEKLNVTKSRLQINLSIGYQNIEGLHHATLGCKLDNCITLENDIEVLAESWTECENCDNIRELDDHFLLECIKPIKTGTKGRKSGGIKIFLKKKLKNSIKVIKSTDNYAWLEIDKNLFHELEKNILVCAIYSQPASSKYYSEEVWEALENDLIYMTNNEVPFCILGDMNGRTGTESEFLEIPKNEEIPDTEGRKIKESKRNNCDKETCQIGTKILNLCKSYEMQIGNGRLNGDFMGNFTHYNKNKGQSTVDLALISDSLFNDIDDLKILPQETFSDHSKIILTISNMKEVKDEQPKEYEWINMKPAFKWQEDSEEQYKAALESEEVNEMIRKCRRLINTNKIEDAGKTLQEIFITGAKLSLEEKKSQTTNHKPQGKKKKTKKKPNKKWFDDDCKRLKKESNKASRKKNLNPTNVIVREDHKKKLKEFNMLCRDKKNQFWIKETNKLNNLRKENDFWKKWKNFGEDVKAHKDHPGKKDGKKWEEFFKNLYTAKNGDIDSKLKKLAKPINKMLNDKANLNELKTTISNLKKDKAVGMDRIANEFLMAAPDRILKLLLDIINKNIETGITCIEWCKGVISLIHKEGPIDDPNNYRGICVMNALLKVLCTLLNNRLITFCTEKKLINKAQIGFWKNCRTTDHIATLKTVVNKYIIDIDKDVKKKKTRKLYACFIDFQKAFDSVWHEGMFRKLENLGINGNFLNLIKHIYKSMTCNVKIDNKCTQSFRYEKGVQQGNPLSPLLFNLFINDIFQAMKNDNMVTIDNENYFNTLMYADDLIILAPTHRALQRSLDGLYSYCEKWQLNINMKKTKCMTFAWCQPPPPI